MERLLPIPDDGHGSTEEPSRIDLPLSPTDQPVNTKSTLRQATTFILAFLSVITLVHADNPESQNPPQPNVSVPLNPAIHFGGFIALAQELQELREARRVPIEVFVQMAKHPDTIILDTRSKAAYDDVHISGAVHLNFSDFTDEKLHKTIPSKQTRILIYCNNNFIDESNAAKGKALPKRAGDGIVQGLTDKRPSLALNIPTFINLHGYGYENVYELADRLHISDARVLLVGNSINAAAR